MFMQVLIEREGIYAFGKVASNVFTIYLLIEVKTETDSSIVNAAASCYAFEPSMKNPVFVLCSLAIGLSTGWSESASWNKAESSSFENAQRWDIGSGVVMTIACPTPTTTS